MIRRLLQHFRRINRQRELLGLLNSCGIHTELLGSIVKRHPDGRIVIGRDSHIRGDLVTETSESQIAIGNNVFIGGGSLLDCVVSIEIEDDVLISYQCLLADSDNHSHRYSVRKHDLSDWKDGGRHDWSKTISRPIRLCRGAWVGARSIILKGVTLGEGAVVGAGSVVTHDVAPYTIVAGNPARVIREIPVDER